MTRANVVKSKVPASTKPHSIKLTSMAFMTYLPNLNGIDPHQLADTVIPNLETEHHWTGVLHPKGVAVTKGGTGRSHTTDHLARMAEALSSWGTVLPRL